MAVRIFTHEEEKRKLRQTVEKKRCGSRQLGEKIQPAQGKGIVTSERKVPPYRPRDGLVTKKVSIYIIYCIVLCIN